jgi:xanthine dehydrogenase accessory factor
VSRREIERILDAIRQARAAGRRAALATVVRVRGSAYRREGTQILVRDDGTHECALSGGCLEPAVADAAQRVIRHGGAELLSFDLDDDSVFGLGIGCTGAVDILIERVEDDEITRAWLGALERAEPAVLVIPLSGASGRLLVRQDDVVGELGRDAELVVTSARERLAMPFAPSACETVGAADLFFAIHAPPPHLVIFGAGYDAVPLARGGWELGFAVTVVDPRDAYLTPERFPGMTRVAAHCTEFASRVALTSRSFVVVMNHHLERDRESLRFALTSDAAFVGVLGPRSRLQKLIHGLERDGYVPDANALSRLRSPVGLALGAETPEEIAVAILGELVAVQRGFDGGFLTGRELSLHRSRDQRSFARS